MDLIDLYAIAVVVATKVFERLAELNDRYHAVQVLNILLATRVFLIIEFAALTIIFSVMMS